MPGRCLRFDLAWLKQSFGDQRFPQGHRLVAVDLQHADGRSADGGPADQDGALVAEVVAPFVAAGMEQAGELSRFRVQAGNVRSLEAITIPACDCEIGGDGTAAVLAGDDVVDLEREGRCFLRQAAVFASSGGSLADMLGRAAAMRSVDRLVLLQRPAGLGVHQVEQEADAAVILQLGFLLGRELVVLILVTSSCIRSRSLCSKRMASQASAAEGGRLSRRGGSAGTGWQRRWCGCCGIRWP